MAQHHFEEARRLIGQSPGVGRFDGGRSGAAISRAQEMLGVSFPQSYRSFLRHFGAGHIPLHEFYGLVDDDCSTESAPNVVWITRDERRFGLPPTYVVVEPLGDGGLYCLDTARTNEGECPVVFYAPHSAEKAEHVSSDFGKYFLDCVVEALMEPGSRA